MHYRKGASIGRTKSPIRLGPLSPKLKENSNGGRAVLQVS
jgi:hypothetical protein